MICHMCWFSRLTIKFFLQQSKVFVFSWGWGEAGVGEGSCRQMFRITSWTRYKGCRTWNNIGDMSKKEAKLEPQIDCIIGKISESP